MTLEYIARLDAPAACTASSEEIAAQSAMACALRDEASEVTRLDGGIRLRFAPDAERRERIVEWMERESACCSFLGFRLDEAAGGELTLEITGGDVADAWIATVLEA
jgi:hypothetical protein